MKAPTYQNDCYYIQYKNKYGWFLLDEDINFEETTDLEYAKTKLEDLRQEISFIPSKNLRLIKARVISTFEVIDGEL